MAPSALGAHFGRLVVIEDGDTGKHRQVRVRCACGQEKRVRLAHLRAGATTSCGCARGRRPGTPWRGRRTPTPRGETS